MTTPEPSTSRPPLWRDVRVLRVAGQVAAVVVVFLILQWLIGNLVTNYGRLNISFDFGFLNQPTQFQIANHPQFNPRSPVWRMVLVGVKNTALAGVFGIALAGVLGLIIGIGRLSQNWLAAKLSAAYVEFFRNIPPLVVIVFFAFAVFLYGPLPNLRQAIEIPLFGTGRTALILSNAEWGVPGMRSTGNLLAFGVSALVAVVAAAVVWRWRTRLNERSGEPHHRVLWSLGVLLAILVVSYVALGGPLVIDWPQLSENRRRIASGFSINSGFMSVAGALGLYTASHVAEIIRGSILAVPWGQTEASFALALTNFQRYRFVVLPQAMRIAVPPLINQALNLIKNTSLAAAVGYAEITTLTQTSIGNGRPAVQSVVILMVVYLGFSLLVSLILNIVNRRLQLVTR